MEENNQNEVMSTKNSEKGNKKIIVLIACIVGVLAITVGLLAMGGLGNNGSKVKLRTLKGTPQEIVHTALLNTQDKLASEMTLLEERNGGKVLADILKSEAADMNFNVKIKGVSGMENESIINAVVKDLAVQGDLAYTKDGKYWNADLKAKQGDLELVGATLYKADQELGIDIPKVLGNPYAIKLDTLFEDLQNSPMYALGGGESIDEAQIEEVKEMFTAIGDYFNGILGMADNKEYIDKVNKLYEDTIKGLDIEKLNEKVEGYDVYEVTLTGEQMANFNKEQMAIIMELDFADRLFNLVAKYSGVTQEELLEQIAQGSTYGDVDVKFELHVDDYFIRSGVCTIIDNAYDEEMISVEFNLGDKENLLNEIGFSFGVNDEAQVEVAFNNNLGEKGSVFEQAFKVSITSDGETGFISYNTSYDSKAKDNNFEVNFEATLPYTGSATIAGKGTKVVSAKEISTTIDELTCKVSDDYSNEMQVNLAVEYGAKVIKAKDVKFESKEEVKYVLELTTAELMAIAQSIQSNIQSIGSAFLQ